jgi:hypothetical protein
MLAACRDVGNQKGMEDTKDVIVAVDEAMKIRSAQCKA